jgi:hypothetical protein
MPQEAIPMISTGAKYILLDLAGRFGIVVDANSRLPATGFWRLGTGGITPLLFVEVLQEFDPTLRNGLSCDVVAV